MRDSPQVGSERQIRSTSARAINRLTLALRPGKPVAERDALSAFGTPSRRRDHHFETAAGH